MKISICNTNYSLTGFCQQIFPPLIKILKFVGKFGFTGRFIFVSKISSAITKFLVVFPILTLEIFDLLSSLKSFRS